MKKYKFSWLPLFAIVGFAGLHIFSCQRDTEHTQVKPLSDTPVNSREFCDNPSYCNCVVTTNATTTLTICGDLLQGTGSCTGCDTGESSLSGTFIQNEKREFCVLPSGGDICITNTGSSSVGVTIQFGNSTPITVIIGASQTQCFHTTDCTDTNTGCS
jgi:hypothetical protein